MTLATTVGAQAQALPEGLIIRAFDAGDADYAGVVAVHNLIYTEYPTTIDEWKHDDAHTEPHLKHRRWVAALGDTILGYGAYDQNEGSYNPRVFQVEVVVRPDRHGQGIGHALYTTIAAALAPFDPLRLRTQTRADRARALRFLAARGFVEDHRDWESRLDVASFDPAPYAGHEARVRAAGIELLTLAELAARDPDYKRKVYELDLELSRDVPSSEPRTPFAYDGFEHHVFNSPSLLPEGFFLAVDGERYVGLSNLWRSESDPRELYTGLTAICRDYRRRGIALALKLRAIDYARRHGVVTLKTWNESNNRAMLSINEALGFVKQPAWISYVKHISGEPDGTYHPPLPL